MVALSALHSIVTNGIAAMTTFAVRLIRSAGGGPTNAPYNSRPMMSLASRRYSIVVAAIIIVTLARIAATHLLFAQTLDEPVHVAAGHEWLTQGFYHLDFQHPPLPRAFFALPFLDIRRVEHPTHPSEYGNDLYAAGDHYIHNVAAARRGNLPFVLVAALAVAAIARRLFGNAVAIVALLFFVSLPPVLAHGGLATTDMPAAAGFALALWALLRWSDEPSIAHSILLGSSIAFGILCKYSFFAFFPAAMLVVLVARRRLAPAKLLVVAATAFVVTWGAFGFSFSTLAAANPQAHDIARAAGVADRWTVVKVPAPDLAMGLLTVAMHNRIGHPAFLLGQTSQTGWWYYFPVALGVKTPIPYLLLAAAGAWLLLRKRHRETHLVVLAAALLAVAMASRINIGIRHLLPIYVPLSIVAAFAAVELWTIHRTARAAVVAAAGWLIIGSVLAHPDYLPWMNVLAGRRPQHVLLDSNFDWGQDIWRLARICRKRGVTSLEYAVVTNVRPGSIGITGGHPLDENVPAHGWIVASEQNIELARVKNGGAFTWLDRMAPFERVGKTLRLYHAP